MSRECECVLCEMHREIVNRNGEDDLDRLDEREREEELEPLEVMDGEEKMARRAERSRAAEDQSDFPDTLFVERMEEERGEDDEVYYSANTAPDLLEDGMTVGIYKLVDVKMVKRTVELE